MFDQINADLLSKRDLRKKS